MLPQTLEVFKTTVLTRGRTLYRDLPWRRDRNPYGILVSEFMLQQTQVGRVKDYWSSWLEAFPTVDALAAAPLSEVLQRWQGLGYNRRAVNLQRSARIISERYDGLVPSDRSVLLALPGVGPATCAGVRVFAYGLADMYLETNVRTVFINELFPNRVKVSDRELVDLVEATCDRFDPATWYYALLDYGTYLKAVQPNPSRRSTTHSVQSCFEGSHRQKRAQLLRMILAGADTAESLTGQLDEVEMRAGRRPPHVDEVEELLAELENEGFLYESDGLWNIGSDRLPNSESS